MREETGSSVPRQIVLLVSWFQRCPFSSQAQSDGKQDLAKEILLWLPNPRNVTLPAVVGSTSQIVPSRTVRQLPSIANRHPGGLASDQLPLQDRSTDIGPIRTLLIIQEVRGHCGNMMPTGSRAYGDEWPVSWTGFGFTGNKAVQVDDISALGPLEVYNGGFAGESSKPEPSSQYNTISAFQCWQQGFASSTVRILGTSDSKDRNHWLLRKCFSMLHRIPRNLEHTGHPSNYEMDDLANEIGSNSAAADEFATNHTLAERKRRKKQSDSFQTLRSILPPSRKMDKASVLRSTVDYLKQLQTEKEQLQERRQRLESLLMRQEQEQELELVRKLQSLGNRETGM